MAGTWMRTSKSAGEGQKTPAGDWRAAGWDMESLELEIRACPQGPGLCPIFEMLWGVKGIKGREKCVKVDGWCMVKWLF